MLLFKSKEYKEGYKAGQEGIHQLKNPYSRDATRHNLDNGMGASPWWDTNYQPFIEWERGWRDARQPIVDKYLDEYRNECRDRLDNRSGDD